MSEQDLPGIRQLEDHGFVASGNKKWERSGLTVELIGNEWYLCADFSAGSICTLASCPEGELTEAVKKWFSPDGGFKK